MGISFEDSLKQMVAEAQSVDTIVLEASITDSTITPSVMTLSETSGMIVAYSGDEGNWSEYDTDYEIYSFFEDSNISIIDEKKEIKLNGKQINITQEENSQYIPFEMPRYYDGFDLSETTISIHYETKDKYHGISYPINVQYSDGNGDKAQAKIRFAWLVDAGATQVSGKLKFEIHADGNIDDTKGYTWKSQFNEELNVLQSLCMSENCDDVIINKINDDTWVTTLVTKVAENVADKIANAQIGSQVAAAEAAANRAETAAVNAEQSAVNADEVATEAVTIALTNYPTRQEVTDAIKDADISDKLNDYYTTDQTYSKNEVDTAINTKADGYYTKDETASYVAATLIDGNYATKTDVADAIAAEDITTKLGDYYTKDDTYNKGEIDAAIEGIDVSEQLGDLGQNSDGSARTVAQYVENKINTIDHSSFVTIDAISEINDDITAINIALDGIDKSPNVHYATTYNQPYTFNDVYYAGENTLVLYEITGKDTEDEVRNIVSTHVISGGSGSGSSNDLNVEKITPTNTAFSIDNPVILEFNFTAVDKNKEDLGQGIATWKLGEKTIINKEVMKTGYNYVDLTEFFSIANDQKLTLIVTDDIGTIFQTNWFISVVDIRLESSFNDTRTYTANTPVSVQYTPYGGVDKTVHFVLDGDVENEVTVSSLKAAAGRQASYIVPAHGHGSHLLDMYLTATVNGKEVESDHIYKDILWKDDSSSVPLIGCPTPYIETVQHNTVNIKYTVFDPNAETPEVTWYLDGEVLGTEVLTDKDEYGYYTYSYKANNCGAFELAVKCDESELKTIKLKVEELNIDVEPVTAGLAFDFNPIGYSNNSTNRLWSYNDISMSVSDNFDWVNGGYQLDENGDQYFCVKAGTRATIDYKLFADDPKKDGKEFKVIFRTRNIRKRDTSFLSCINENIGLDMKVEKAIIYSSDGSTTSNYCEDEIIEYEFNINKSTDMRIVMTYEDGTPNIPYEYMSTSSFKQTTPQPITIGSDDCDICIYRMKAYSISLTDVDIKNNFITDARNADEMIARYNRNQIYDENTALVSTTPNGGFDASNLMKAAPDLRYIFLEVPRFTWDKDVKIDGCTVYFRYPAGTRPEDNWTCTGVRHRGQGTSSNEYGYAGRNIDLCMDRDESLFTWIDEEGNTVESSTITLTDTSVPTDYLNIKVNIASSENTNNAQMARRFNEYQPFLRYARKKDSRVKDTMEFYNCVVFIRETSEDPTLPRTEFNDTDWHKTA